MAPLNQGGIRSTTSRDPGMITSSWQGCQRINGLLAWPGYGKGGETSGRAQGKRGHRGAEPRGRTVTEFRWGWSVRKKQGDVFLIISYQMNMKWWIWVDIWNSALFGVGNMEWPLFFFGKRIAENQETNGALMECCFWEMRFAVELPKGFLTFFAPNELIFFCCSFHIWTCCMLQSRGVKFYSSSTSKKRGYEKRSTCADTTTTINVAPLR